MGNWNLVGTLLVVGLFLFLVGIILAQIHVTNPLTGTETSVFAQIIDWIVP